MNHKMRFLKALIKGGIFSLLTGYCFAAEPPPFFKLKWGASGSADGQFSIPLDVAVDSSNNVYVLDKDNNRIQKFTSTGTFLTKWGSGCNLTTGFGCNTFAPGAISVGDGQFAFATARGIAVDTFGNVYVVDSGNNRVQKFTSNGVFLTKWGSAGSGDGQFSTAYRVAVDTIGNVYVVDWGNNRVQKFTSTGTFLTKWGSAGSGDGQFSSPRGIAVDFAGNVYLADEANNRIQKFNSNGNFIIKWGSVGSADGQFNQPFGIAADIPGNVYVAEFTGNRIQKFSSTGTFITKWGNAGSGDGQFNFPSGIAVDIFGNSYVADAGNDRVQVFGPVTADTTSPTVTSLTPINSSTVTTNHAIIAATYQDNPGGSGINLGSVALFLDGTDVTAQAVVTTFSITFTPAVSLADGVHVASVTVADNVGNKAFATTSFFQDSTPPTITSLIPVKGSTITTGRPLITATYNDNLLGSGINLASVKLFLDGTDVTAQTVVTASSITFIPITMLADGIHVASVTVADNVGNRTSADTTFFQDATSPTIKSLIPINGSTVITNRPLITVTYQDNPSGSGVNLGSVRLLFDSTDVTAQSILTTSSITFSPTVRLVDGPHIVSIIVADNVNNSTSVTNSFFVNTSSQQFGSSGSGDGLFNIPTGVTVDVDENVYVVDSGNNRIQKFTSGGTFLTKWNAADSPFGSFNMPLAIGAGSVGSIFVADSGNHSIEKFNSTGAFISLFGGLGSGGGQFNNPTNVATDLNGNIYVCDRFNNRIQKFSSNGAFITLWGSPGSDNSQFSSPFGIAVDTVGNVYVADSGNSRVQKFTSNGTFIIKWGNLGTSDGQFNNPTGIAVDLNGNVYLADTGNNRIQQFSSDGIFIRKFGVSGTALGQFNQPFGVAADKLGDLYVADSLNQRIQVFPVDSLPVAFVTRGTGTVNGFPEIAFVSTQTITITIVSSASSSGSVVLATAASQGFIPVSTIYQFGPPGSVFNPPGTITFRYSTSSIPSGVSEFSLVLYQFITGTGLVPVFGQTIDPVNKLITAPLSTFSSIFLILAPIDTTPPVTTLEISSPTFVAFGTTDISPKSSIILSAVDPIIQGRASGVKKIELRADNFSFRDYVSTLTMNDLLPGASGFHTIEYRAVDQANNQETSKFKTVFVTIFPDYAFVGINSLSIKGGSQVIGDVRSNGKVEIKGQSKVTGSVFGKTVTVIDKSTVTGQIVQNAVPISSVPIDLTSISSAVSQSNDNAKVSRTQKGKSPVTTDGRFTLSDGDSLTLSSGSYYFKAIKVEGKAAVTLSGKVNILCVGDIEVEGGAKINSGGNIADLVLFVDKPPKKSGDDQGSKDKDNNVQEGEVKFEGQSEFAGIVYAPYAEIGIEGKSRVAGSLFGLAGDVEGEGAVTTQPDRAFFASTSTRKGNDLSGTPEFGGKFGSTGPSPDFILGEVYSFPNPIVGASQRATIHVECGVADVVEIRIYDIAGGLIKEVTIDQEPKVINNKYAYEYAWDTSGVASGVYVYVVRAKKDENVLKIVKKIGVVK